VPVTEEELESLEAEANRSIDLKEFIPLASVDPVYFENTHYLGASRSWEIKPGDRSGIEVGKDTRLSGFTRIICIRGGEHIYMN
jgi:hypothetical protein